MEKSFFLLFLKTFLCWDFPGGSVVKTELPLQGAQVPSLVGS